VNLAAAKALEARTTDLAARPGFAHRRAAAELDARDAAHRGELEARDAEGARLRAEVAELRAQVQALVRAQATAKSP
jgi:hypothetical protein